MSLRFTEEMMKHPDNMDTMEKVARWLVSKYQGRQCLGTRLLLGEEKVNNNDGKEATKLIQGEYVWITYSDLERLSRSFARGLLERGVKPRDKVGKTTLTVNMRELYTVTQQVVGRTFVCLLLELAS